ncbi:LysR family transcriptional regulator [Yersinia enterocolitica]|uniref:LysR family transcriptional regulator n=1 Tax=Yersinia enterocolitica TaxID=630 RepID=UPI00065A8391|nr:LysR family transcriptional regulator [Yersinia enterocolitica]CRY16724.1 LysR family transcriptional regulator [Yersinia enterocolitica]
MKKFDYNLVKLLQCLIEFRSVTRTAEELDVAISTVSHGLARLRREFNDRIVINTKEGLVPTTLAITLNSHFSSAANLIDNAIAAGKNSDSAQNSLTISASPLIQHWLSCQIYQLSQSSDMGESFTIKYVDSHYTSEQRVSRLRNSEVDIDIGSILDIDRSLVSYHLGSFPLGVLLSNSHSRIPSDITKDDWLQEQRLIWNLNTQRALFIPGRSFNDIHVNDNAKIETTNSLNAVTLVANTDYLAIFPFMMQSFLAKQFNVRMSPLPFSNDGVVSYYAYINKKSDSNNLIRKCLKIIANLH